MRQHTVACLLLRSLYTLRVELYSSPADQVRLAFEVLLTLAVFVQLLVQLGQMLMTWWVTACRLSLLLLRRLLLGLALPWMQSVIMMPVEACRPGLSAALSKPMPAAMM